MLKGRPETSPKKEEKKTFELLKEKSVVIISLFAFIMLSASVYTMNRSAAVAAEMQTEEPECTVLFIPASKDVAVGETFSVKLIIDDVKNFWGFEIGLAFNPDVLEYVGAQTPSWKFISGTHPRLAYYYWAAGIQPQNGEVELMEFTFRGKAAGSTSLSLYSHILATLKYWDAPHDYVGWPIPHLVSDGVVNVS